MDHSAPYISCYLILFIAMFVFPVRHGLGQALSMQKEDTVGVVENADPFYLYTARKQEIQEKTNALLTSRRDLSKQLVKSKTHVPFGFTKPMDSLAANARFLDISGGSVSYAMNYRSIIDTPYAEKNILQHNVSGAVNFLLAGFMPLQLTYLIRRSNSEIFRNIHDLQLSLDPGGLKKSMLNQFRNQLDQYAGNLEDSLTGKLLDLKSQDLKLTGDWLKNHFQLQRLIEANEILKVPGITYASGLSIDENMVREDSLKKEAEKFISLYKQIEGEYSALQRQTDSLKIVYEEAQSKANRLRQLAREDINTYASYLDWRSKISDQDIAAADLPKGYKRLLAVRSFSLGRTPLNYSELTVKNISINGINVEYNSWYYAAFAAGSVDFRFRDFAIGANRQPQYLVMGRAGIGNLDKNYFILSALRGRKQLFAARANTFGASVIDLKVFSAEAKWRISRDSYLTGEVGQSIGPDFRNNDPVDGRQYKSSDHSNKAAAIKFYTYYPKTRSRFEAFYKYAGANYQSFSSFQTNSSQKAWYIKGEQNLFGKLLKLSASVRSNDFSNPYIIQHYRNSSVFKSFNATIRKRKWPVLSMGYMPISQFTKLDDQLMEYRFQSLNANIYHYYTVRGTQTASTLMFNKFYNHSGDSGFVYYNASNIYWGQNIFLNGVVANISVSDTRNGQFQSQVFDESIQMNIGKLSTLLIGAKVNNFNRQQVKVGGYMNASIRIWKNDRLYVFYERGFLPGFGKRLVRNDVASIQFIKVFGPK